MKIAIIGTGIAGLVAARLLATRHEITVFEAAGHVGGHTHTHDVVQGHRTYAVDTGFIVFNERTYPHFVRLLASLGVASQPTRMSFSVQHTASGLEYAGTNLNTVFAQRRNLLRPSFHRMLRDILRFNRSARAVLEGAGEGPTLGEYLAAEGYGRAFVEHYLVPMGAAIWSADPARMLDFPARTFVRFFDNHGLLSVNDQPRWRVVCGGSRSYVDALTAPFRERIRLHAPVESVRRVPDGVLVTPPGGAPERFDHVVIAAHSDQALRLLADPTPAERAVLGAIPYQPNEAVLHTDRRLMPHNRRAWAAWNYHLPHAAHGAPTVTYDMNALQGLDAPEPFLVTLNRTEAIDPLRVLRRMTYHHPVFTHEAIRAQQRHGEISGVHRTHFCGAYWGYGFHEDGVRSALAVCERFGLSLDDLHTLPAGRAA